VEEEWVTSIFNSAQKQSPNQSQAQNQWTQPFFMVVPMNGNNSWNINQDEFMKMFANMQNQIVWNIPQEQTNKNINQEKNYLKEEYTEKTPEKKTNKTNLSSFMCDEFKIPDAPEPENNEKDEKKKEPKKIEIEELNLKINPRPQETKTKTKNKVIESIIEKEETLDKQIISKEEKIEDKEEKIEEKKELNLQIEEKNEKEENNINKTQKTEEEEGETNKKEVQIKDWDTNISIEHSEAKEIFANYSSEEEQDINDVTKQDISEVKEEENVKTDKQEEGEKKEKEKEKNTEFEQKKHFIVKWRNKPVEAIKKEEKKQKRTQNLEKVKNKKDKINIIYSWMATLSVMMFAWIWLYYNQNIDNINNLKTSLLNADTKIDISNPTSIKEIIEEEEIPLEEREEKAKYDYLISELIKR